jgi:hypothetical protein
VDTEVIKPSVKLSESNIKLFQLTHHFTLETENVKIYDITEKKLFDGSHSQLEQTDLLQRIEKVSNVLCGI